MSRTLRQFPDILQKLDEQQISKGEQALWVSYDVTVITPIFGGGAVSNQVYTEKPVRESTVRGQLRFWWRATRGAAFNSVYELRQREREIFGDTMKPSSLKIVVENLTEVQCQTYDPRDRGSSIPPYLFQDVRSYISDYRFKLKLRWSDQIKKLSQENQEEFDQLNCDLNAALWGWINFGGIGSRTRRGTGSLFCPNFSLKKFQTNPMEFSKWLTTSQNRFKFKLIDDETKEWPTLSSRMRIDFRNATHNANWKKLIKNYKDFRRRANAEEKYNAKKKKYMAMPTRSHWPEADYIREILDAAHPKHENPLHYYKSAPKEQVRAFPRAVLGLPIIFQFKKINEPAEKYLKGRKARRSLTEEPHQTQLTPVNKERLASPIILKPLAFESSRSIALIAVLNHPKIESLELKVLEGPKKDEIARLSVEFAPLDYRLSPLQGETQLHSNAIDAFLDSKEVKDFWNPQKP